MKFSTHDTFLLHMMKKKMESNTNLRGGGEVQTGSGNRSLGGLAVSVLMYTVNTIGRIVNLKAQCNEAP